MRPSTLLFTLKQGFKNIKRNWMFSMASIITMAACIFMFGVFYAIINNVNYVAHQLEEEVPITVFFDEDTTEEEMQAVGDLIAARPEVSEIIFESGDEAWEEFKESYFGGSDAAEAFVDDNPLEYSSNYQVYLNDITKQSVVAAYIETLDHVRLVNQSEEAADTLGSINKLVFYISAAVIAILLLISVFLISNTISVGITVRKEEIGIMKYIGATDGFVRAPFVLEGMTLGLIGAAIPLVLLYFVYSSAVNFIFTRFNVLSGSVELISVLTVYRTLVPISLALGIGIGLVGSFVTTKKHLRV
ncbi:MAG: permease-like cell division protein FtsX [Clostridiales bacterium]|nr:permease-like cell division protein FtsX [Clostridiales bacterium]